MLLLNNFNISYETNTSEEGSIKGVGYSAYPFEIVGNHFLNITFDIIGSIGDYSNIVIDEFIINTTNVLDYSIPGLVTIGSFGCMDKSACNYDEGADTNDGSCEYTCYGCTAGTANNYDPTAYVLGLFNK